MNPPRVCRICGRDVTSPDAWVEIERLPGRFWLCAGHAKDALFIEDRGRILYSRGPEQLLLGPYPYDRVPRVP